MTSRLRFLVISLLAATALSTALSKGFFPAEAQAPEYEWGRIVSPEALASFIADRAAMRLPRPVQTCRIHLDHLNDPRLEDARLLITFGFFEKGGWLVYDGPVAATLDLELPAVDAPQPLQVQIQADALASDDLHIANWNSYRAYEFDCGAAPHSIRLLRDFDPEGTGGNLHLIVGDTE